MRSLLGVITLCASATAAPASKLTMRHVDGTNLHIANRGGAMHWSADVTVAVELRPDGTVEASSGGWRKKHDLHRDGRNTEDVTRFALGWKGTWAQRGTTLALALELVGNTCSRRKIEDGRPPEVIACRVATKRMQLTCTSAQVTLEGPTRTVDAWACASEGLGESPAWLLGKTLCIQTSGQHVGAAGLRTCAGQQT